MNDVAFRLAKRAMLAAVIVFALAACMLLFGCQSEQPSATDETITSEAEDTEKPIDGPFYALLVGNDSRTGTVEIDQAAYSNGLGRSDTMMLARIDPDTYTIALVTVPRDTRTEIDGTVTKLNSAYEWYGIDGAKEQVELLTGVSVDFYFDVGFEDFQKLIDGLGGVPANVPVSISMQDIVSGDDVSISAGEQVLNGVQALVFARERHTYGDNQEAIRQSHDRDLVISAINKVLADPTMVDTAVSALISNADTDMSENQLKNLVSDFAQHADQVTIYEGTGPYSGDIDAETQLWLTVRDEDTWAQVIAAVDAGEDPSAVLSSPSL